MEKKMDLRIVKTYAALTEALETLLLEKPLNEITVSEICERAMVRRATFYKHFGDKNELLVFLFKEMKEDIKKKRDEAELSAQDLKKNLYCDIVIMLDYIEAKEALFCALENDCSVRMIFNLVADSLTKDIREYLSQNGNKDQAQSASFTLTCQLLTGALLHGIMWWLNHKALFTKQEVAEQLYTFFIRAVEGGEAIS